MNQIKNQKGGDSISQELEEFEEPQRRYILAKSTIEAIKQTVSAETRSLRKKVDNASDEEFEELMNKEIEIEEKHGLFEAQEAKRQVEKELVNWAFGSLEGKGYDVSKFETVKENWNKNPRIKKKVIDVAMRYNPNGGQ